MMPSSQDSLKSAAICLPPGFRFQPSEEELVGFYLSSKLLNITCAGVQIPHIDITAREPSYFADVSKGNEYTGVYFFSAVPATRITTNGYWKVQKHVSLVRENGCLSRLPAVKTTLVYYEGQFPKGERSEWVMNEFRFVENNRLKFPSEVAVYQVSRLEPKKSKPLRLRPCKVNLRRPAALPEACEQAESCSNSSSDQAKSNDVEVSKPDHRIKRSFVEESDENSDTESCARNKRIRVSGLFTAVN